MTITIKDGKRYIMRDGEIAMIIDSDKHGFISDWGIRYEHGNYYNADKTESEYDIVAEYNPEQVKEPDIEWKFPVGSTIAPEKGNKLIVHSHVQLLECMSDTCKPLQYFCYNTFFQNFDMYEKGDLEQRYSLVE